MKTDIQIAQEAKIVNVLEIAKKVGLTEMIWNNMENIKQKST